MKGAARWIGLTCHIFLGTLIAVFSPWLVALADRPVVDANIHYSHDAWDTIPAPRALEILEAAGIRRAFVSSSSDQGTQKLYQLDPDRIVPVLRPYRRRGELGSWMYDETVPPMLEALLGKNYYAGIGEFHAFGDDIELPVLKKVIELASSHRLFLHAHSDSSAVENIFAYDENAIVLWAHSGFENSAEIDRMLSQYPNLWADLAFRYEHESAGRVMPEWRKLFLKYPDRFMLGTDTYTPERWFYVIDHATSARRWLDDLPTGIAENIAWKNAEALLQATK
jgi:hypothetical protein